MNMPKDLKLRTRDVYRHKEELGVHPDREESFLFTAECHWIERVGILYTETRVRRHGQPSITPSEFKDIPAQVVELVDNYYDAMIRAREIVAAYLNDARAITAKMGFKPRVRCE